MLEIQGSAHPLTPDIPIALLRRKTHKSYHDLPTLESGKSAEPSHPAGSPGECGSHHPTALPSIPPTLAGHQPQTPGPPRIQRDAHPRRGTPQTETANDTAVTNSYTLPATPNLAEHTTDRSSLRRQFSDGEPHLIQDAPTMEQFITDTPGLHQVGFHTRLRNEIHRASDDQLRILPQ